MKTALPILGGAVLLTGLLFAVLSIRLRVLLTGLEMRLLIALGILGVIIKRFEFLIRLESGRPRIYAVRRDGPHPLPVKKRQKRFGLPRVLRLLGHIRLDSLSVDAALGICGDAALTVYLSGAAETALQAVQPLMAMLFENSASARLNARVRPVFGRDELMLRLAAAADTSLFRLIKRPR